MSVNAITCPCCSVSFRVLPKVPWVATDALAQHVRDEHKPSETRGGLSDRQAKVFELLKDGAWHATAEICGIDVGGTEGTRRLRELRNKAVAGFLPGFKDLHKKKKPGSDQYLYRLIRAAPLLGEQTGLFGNRTRDPYENA